MGIFDIFKNKKIKGSSNETKISSNKPVLPDLANDIHKKFHLTCDVLEKIKPNTNCDDLIKQLNLVGISEEKFSNNTFEIDLDIGNGWIFSKIQNANHSMSNFQKYNFSITGIQDYSGLYLSSIKGFKDNSNEIQIDAPINPGNSGGPIINENGDLVAIAVAGMTEAQNINFGIKSSAAERFLMSNNINPKKSMYSGIKDNDQLLEILEEGTVYTYCN